MVHLSKNTVCSGNDWNLSDAMRGHNPESNLNPIIVLILRCPNEWIPWALDLRSDWTGGGNQTWCRVRRLASDQVWPSRSLIVARRIMKFQAWILDGDKVERESVRDEKNPRIRSSGANVTHWHVNLRSFLYAYLHKQVRGCSQVERFTAHWSEMQSALWDEELTFCKATIKGRADKLARHRSSKYAQDSYLPSALHGQCSALAFVDWSMFQFSISFSPKSG